MSNPRCWNCRKVLQEEGANCARCGASKLDTRQDWFKSAVVRWAINFAQYPEALCCSRVGISSHRIEAMRVVRGELVLHEDAK